MTPVTSPLSDRLKACFEKHADWTDERIAAAIVGSTRAMVRAMRAGEPLPEPPTKPECAAVLHPNVTLVSVDDIKRKYDMFGAIMEIIKTLPPGQVITEGDLKQSVDHPDPYRFKKTMDAHEKELEPYRIMLKYRGSEAKYHYGKPEVIADLRVTLEKP